MWTAERLETGRLRQNQVKEAAQDAIQNHQEYRELNAFCSLNLSVTFWCRTSDTRALVAGSNFFLQRLKAFSNYLLDMDVSCETKLQHGIHIYVRTESGWGI